MYSAAMIATALAGAPAFQQIMREKAHMPSDVFGIDGFHRGKRRRGQAAPKLPSRLAQPALAPGCRGPPP